MSSICVAAMQKFELDESIISSAFIKNSSEYASSLTGIERFLHIFIYSKVVISRGGIMKYGTLKLSAFLLFVVLFIVGLFYIEEKSLLTGSSGVNNTKTIIEEIKIAKGYCFFGFSISEA